MLYHCTIRSRFLVTLSVLTIAAGSLALRAAPPTAPSNLAATVNGLNVTLTWTASANAPTAYILQAGFAPGETAATVPLSPSSTVLNASAGAGTYYVRMVAVNNDGASSPSNEIIVTLTSGCVAPSPPFNLRAMIRGPEAFVFWRRPVSGSTTGYTLQAGVATGQTIYQFATDGTTLNAVVGGGTFYARVIAGSPCGNSPASNEVVVPFPSNTVRVADPDPGTVLGLPEIRDLLTRIHAENPGLIDQSCPTGRKYEPNPWLNRMIDRLREYDTRFGYNGKPTRGPDDNGGFPVIAAGDEITYFAGAGTAQGSRQVYAIDILQSHCGTPSPTYRDFTGQEEAFWTGAGRFTGDER